MKSKNNSGMTLLEVIVAVSIFSIAAAVLFRAFVTSGIINKKSRLYLEATTVAENIMEEIKAKDFAEVSLAFNYPVDTTASGGGRVRLSFLDSQIDRVKSGSLGIGELLKDGDSYKPVHVYNEETDGEDTSRVTASVISTDNGKTYTFNPRESGDNASKYYFQLTDVNSDLESFDALIEFDGSKSSGYKKKTATNSEYGKNDILMPNISKLDTKTNALLIMGKNWDEDAMKTMVTAQNEYALQQYSEDEEEAKPDTLNAEDVYTKTKRTLQVRITESSGTIKAEARYTLSAYNYVKSDGTKYQRMDICPCHGASLTKGEKAVSDCFCTYTSEYVPFYSAEAGSELESLYVFYYPNYNSTSSVNPLDEIVLDNSTNYPVNFYVTKQRDGAELPTAIQENSYHMSLTIKENPSALGKNNWNTNPSLYRSQTKLRTNLDYNISDPKDVLTRSKVTQMKLTYQAVNSSGANERKLTGTSAKKILDYNGLDNREAMDRIYTATVSVYKAGAAAKGFPEDERVAVLSGAKED